MTYLQASCAPARHDNVDFKPLVERTSDIMPLSIVVADKGYDSEENHVFVRERLHAFSIIPPRYQDVPVWRTHGRYRKQLERGYSRVLYNQRNKDETIISVIKRLFGEHITSRLVRTQNRELTFRCIAYNMHRLTNILVLLVMVSTRPNWVKCLSMALSEPYLRASLSRQSCPQGRYHASSKRTYSRET